ncbi:MAG: outer membrane protein assembly factor BamA [Candidatus Schekmanbacteria bacterium RIFCSPHIGHO2_02_FULL_38_11]|uniref:Outer membrane protein assembly factor BamA n=1 Tax=Candidatus Schekmanbacteria bacterium RIFCSPLOWO2_12_FULL_38_15 TaxID=1817883 RepID=A0A1F7SL46_9BACT|nr:MAG: outer membrane protein assembly factor BamA [Candidatus Schekmanbacteria bacterium GWA2_38_9]OGL48034.1 MAG: outer membrane protein assembly factor BamA [Candidatus Schekmanbacteria bacterium RIFCSPLOWO2_02_FULL_38_14]OGL50698.1 MAG: outer membrane protein assembly factor BamA [Candidatus Schekmanbacteria bacterium RIFCSPHIGHO2_02_FULL_38_11]OGL54481.1 MAG: outer membrane protein assembly factor BamA [Candidatus Schekmanbacteria bacterium RIFCSPLOWO2_12_FULL_38_15]
MRYVFYYKEVVFKGIYLLKNFFMLLIVLLTFSVFFADSNAADEDDGREKIFEIKVQGNKKIETSTILSKIESKAGTFLSSEQISKDISAVFDLGFFKDVQVEKEKVQRGVILTYIVSEKPTVKIITVSGNKLIDTEKIKKEITLIVDTILSRKEIDASIKKIRTLYQNEGYYLVEISYTQKPMPKNSVEVVFNITEGNQVTLKKIIIEGNNAFTDKQIKAVMDTKEDWLFAWATSAGDFKEDVFKKDLEKIDSFYQDNGFIEVEIDEPRIELSSDRKNMFLIIPIKEGRQFKVGRIDIRGNTLFSDKEVAGILGFKKGSIFNRGKLENGIIALSDMHAQKGYLFADIIPVRKFPKDLPVINMNITIDKGERYYLGRIEITGNYKTKDKVIRRELNIAEGDPVNSLKLRQSRDDIYALGFFGDIKAKTKRGKGKNRLDLEMNVEEKPTGTLTFGGGFSSAESLVGVISVSEDNLFGRGYRISLSGQFSTRTTQFDLSFTNPWFMDKPISAGFDLFNRRSEDFNDDYTRKETGGRVRFGFRVFERVWAFFSPKYVNESLSNIDIKSSDIIKQFEGSNTTISNLYSFTRDTRNHPLFPTSGTRHEISYEHAGAFLGGDINFYRIIVDSSKYYPMWGDTALLLHGTFGYVDDYNGKSVPVYERFKLGGARTIRGYQNEDIGPADKFENKIGGNKEIVFNAEYIIPILPNQVQLILFFDAGNAVLNSENLLSNVKKSVGVGTRLFLPIGPVRIDIGYKLDKEKGESATQFHFGVGGTFY